MRRLLAKYAGLSDRRARVLDEVRRGISIVLILAAAIGSRLPAQSANREQQIQEHLMKAQQALQAGRQDQAEQEFRAIVEIDPNNFEARANVGVFRYLRGDWTGAIAYLRPVAEQQPSIWKVRAMLGICEKRAGDAGPAIKDLQAAVANLPDGSLRTQAGLELLELAYSAGDFDKAVDTLRVIERAGHPSADVLYTEYRIYTDLATRAFDTLSLLAPDSGRMHELLGDHLVADGDAEGAILEYRKALAADPKIGGLHYQIGAALLKTRISEAALAGAEKEFEAELALNPRDAASEYELGQIAERRNEVKEAEGHYVRALKSDAHYAPAHAAYGVLLASQRRSGEALTQLTQAVRDDPANMTAHFNLAKLYKESGDGAAADREFAVFKKLNDAKIKRDATLRAMHRDQGH
ncbi:MAG: tetratricopeptide repeat protein [Bryobacteraceae bacterium]